MHINLSVDWWSVDFAAIIVGAIWCRLFTVAW